MLLNLILKRKTKKFYLFIAISVVVFSLLITSCGYNSPSNLIPSNESSQTISQDQTQNIVSGTLRLWMQQPSSLNPLLSFSKQYQNISKLIYQSLFEINNSGEIIPLLVNDFVEGSNKRSYNISIKNNILFHDGTKLTADDIVESFNYIKTYENESPYFYKISYISSISKVNEYEVKFTLKKPNPYFLYDLTFPIIPSDYLVEESEDEEKPEFPSGTGEYKIVDYNEHDFLKLEINENTILSKSNLVKNIDVLILEDSSKAMEKFSEDELDLVILNDELYLKYFLRNDLKMVKYPSNSYMFFDINTNNSKKYENEEFLKYFKSLLKKSTENQELKDYILPGIFTFPMDLAFVPTFKSSFDQITEFNLLEEVEFDLIYKNDDLLSAIIAENIVREMKEYDANIIINLKALDGENYIESISEGEYDLAIRNAYIDNNPDSSWLYLDDPFKKVIESERLELIGDNRLNELVNKYQTFFNQGYNIINSEELYETLDMLSLESNYQGIGFRFNAVIQSKRVNGQIISNSFNKYGIEDIWVWSGQ